MFSRFKKHIAVMVAVMMIVTCLPFSILVRADKVPVLKYVFENENDKTDLRFEDSDDEIDGYNLAGIYVSESSFELTAGMEDLAIVANNADIDGTAAALDEETEIYLLGYSTLKANQYITYASINPNTEFTDELTAENLFGHLEVWGDQLEDFYEFRVTEDYSLDAPGEGLSEKNLRVMEDVTFNLNSSFDTRNAVIDGNLVIKDPENGMINRFMLAYSDNDYACSLTVSATGSLTGEANTELVIGDNIPVNGLDLFENDGVTPILLDDDHDEVTFVWDDGKWILGDFDGPWGPGMIISNQGGEIKEVKYSLDSSSKMYSATERDGEFFISRDIYEDAESVTIYPDLGGEGAEFSYDVLWDQIGEGSPVEYNEAYYEYNNECIKLEKMDDDWGERFDIIPSLDYSGISVRYWWGIERVTYKFDGDELPKELTSHHIPLDELEGKTGLTITVETVEDCIVYYVDCCYRDEEGWRCGIGEPQFTIVGNTYRLEPSDDEWYDHYEITLATRGPGLEIDRDGDHFNGIEYEFENGTRKDVVDCWIDSEEITGDYVKLYFNLKEGVTVDSVEFSSIRENGEEYVKSYVPLDDESILIDKPEGWADWGKYLTVEIKTSRPGMRLDYDCVDWVVSYSVDGGTPVALDDKDPFITPDKYRDADSITFYVSPAREEGSPDFEAVYQYTDYGEGVAWIDADTSNHEFTIEKGADGWHDEYEIWISYPNHEGEDDEPLVDGVNFRYNGEDISKIEYAFDDSTEFTELSDSRVIAPEELADHESLTFKVTMAGNDFKLKNINAEGILLEEDGERWYWLDSGDGEYVEDLSTLTFTLYKHQEEDVDPFWLDRYRFELITTGSGLEISFPYGEIEKVEYLVGDEFKTLEDNIIFPDELDQMEDGISFRLTYLNDAFFSNASVSCDYDNPEIEQYYSGSNWDSDRWSYDPETRILTFSFPDGITWGKYNELSLFTDVPGISVKYFDNEMQVFCFDEEVENHRLERAKFVNEECVVFTLNPYDPSREWVAEFSEGNGEKTTLPIENNEIVINRPADGWAEFYTLDIHEKDDHHDQRIFPDNGYFEVEYDMREVGAEQTAFVKVNGVNVDAYTDTSFTVDTPVTFTLVPPEGLENEPRVVVIENRDGTCASTYDNSIIITNDEFTFTPASDKGFIVKVYWSLFDATHAGSDQVEINIRTNGGAEAAIEDPFASINNPAPLGEGLSETRYIVDQSIIEDDGAIEVIFGATEPATITGVYVTRFDNSGYYYDLDEMEDSNLFNYDEETGKWSYYINDLPGEDDGNAMSIEIFASEPETFTSMFCIDAGEDVSVEYAYIRGENQDPYTAYTGQFDTDTTADAIKIKFTQADGQPLNPLRVAETIPFGPIVGHVIRLDDDNTITITKNPEDGWHAYMIDFEEEGMPADGEFIIKTIGYDSNPVLNYDAETIYTFEPGQTVTIDLGDEEPAYVIAYNSREELDYLERSADGKYSYTTDADWPEALVIKIFRTQDDKDFDGFTPDMDEMALEFHVFYNDYPEGGGHQSVVNFNADDGKWMTSSDGTKTVVHVKQNIESFSFDVRFDSDECREMKIMLNGVDVTNQIDEHGVFTVDADTIRAGLNLSFTFNYRRTFEINGVLGEGGTAGFPASAKEGETVEITGICTIAGYEFDAIVVRYGPDDQIIPVTDNSFVMPSSDVTVYVNFKKINYTITKADMENGTVTVKSTATVGEQVTVTAVPAAGYETSEISVCTVNGGYVPVNNGVFTMPVEDVIVSATFVEHISEPASINGITLDLNDHISINYKMVLPEELLADTGAYVTIVREDATTNYPIAQADMDNKGRYVFKCYLAAAEQRDTVVLSVHRSDGSVYPLLNKEGVDVTSTGFIFSAEAYYEGVNTPGAYPAALLDVLERMLDYGKYAQTYFNYNTGAGSLTPEAETLISDVTLETLDKFKPVIATATDSPITRSGSTLDLRDATVLAHNFVIADGYSVDDFIFTVDGKVVTMSSTGAYRLVYDELQDKYKIVISGIGSGELQKTHKVIVRSAFSGDVLIAIGNYSALSYVYTVVEKINPNTASASNINLLKTMKALYLYNRAAMAYWGGEDDVVDLDPEELPLVVFGRDAAEEVAVVDEAEAVVVDETADVVDETAVDEAVVDETAVDETAAEPVAEESVAEVEGDTVDEADEEVAEPVAGTVETVEAVDTVEETAAE